MLRFLSPALAFVVLAANSVGIGRAQEKFIGPFDPNVTTGAPQGVAFVPTRAMADYKHGTLVRLTLNNGDQVTGTLVRLDPKTKRYYIRTRPGSPPVAYAESDLKDKRVEKAIRKGGIRPAADGPDNVVTPEITEQVIYNGSQRTVYYVSTVISPGERDVLEQMQKAQSDLLLLEERADVRNRAVDTEVGLQAARLETQVLINRTMRMAIAQGDVINYPFQVQNWQTYPGLDLAARREGSTQFPLMIPPRHNITESVPAVSSESLAKAREAVRVAMNRGIYEDGRLVAVLVEEPATKQGEASE
jgi:hypothetical protein